MNITFFTLRWWECVANKWNEYEGHCILAGLGGLSIEASDVKTQVSLHWNEDGTCEVRSFSDPSDAVFAASLAEWKAFIRGDFSAAIGVVHGRIRFVGDVAKIMRYVNGFDEFAIVARNCE